MPEAAVSPQHVVVWSLSVEEERRCHVLSRGGKSVDFRNQDPLIVIDLEGVTGT